MDETNLRESTNSVEPRSADFSGETPRYPMDGNSNCTTWCRWETCRAFRNGQPGWDCRFIINATKTNPYPTYGQGKVQAGMDGREENGTLEEKYIEIVANQVRTYYDQTVFVKAEAGADITLSAYANILVPNVVSKGMKFSISVKRNLWGLYFNANGGSGAPSMQKKYFNNTLYLSTQKPTRSGYTFKGWSTSSSSSYTQYQPGDAFTTDADTTLYAVWSQNVTKTWSITYNANGGYNTPAKQTANIGQSITITYSKPTRSGYTFLGWSTWSGATEPEAMFTPGYSYTSDSDTTLYAVWSQNQTTQYSLSFDLQGGTGTFNTLYGGYGERVQIPYTTPTKSGYTFKGWATYSGGSVSYQPGEYYTLYGNSTLYAVWQSSGGTTQYYLNFNLQGGSGTFNTLYGVYGERLFIPSSSPTKNGYTFQGWSTSSTGSPQYQPGDYYTIYSNTILYAIWGESTQYCTITFDANGGSGAPASQQKDVGEATYIPYAKPTRNGYTFLGWSTSKYTSTADYQPGQAYTPYGDMTFYAVWEQNVVKTWTITYNANGGENAPSPQTANVGQSITITYSKPTRTGYTFLGWSTWSGATEPESIFTPGYSYKSDFNLTLYAVWEKQEEDRYTISFDLQGGSGEFNPLKGKYGEAWYLPNRAPYKSGYIFKGWATSPDGNPEYQPDDIYTIYGNATLYAVWKEKGKPKFTFSKSYDCIPYGIGAVEELVMNATVENPENLKIYYKICFVDDVDGTVNDYATNSNGLTNMIETGIASANLTVQPDILIQSIKNCNNEQSFKIVICSNYDNNFDISNTAINKEIISIRLYYNKPVIQSLDVSHAPYNSAQLVGIVKFSDNFISIASSGNGESVYTDNKPMELGGDYSIDNRFDVDGGNTLRYVFNFNVNKISDANHTFKLVIDDGFFKTEQTVNLGRLSSDENIYIYQDGTIEANGFLLLNNLIFGNEDVILFNPGGFVTAKSFKKISEGVYFCPKVLEAFGCTQRTGG